MISQVVAVGLWLWQGMESAVAWIEVWFLTRRWELAPSAVPAGLVAVLLLLVIFGQRSKPAVAVAEPYRQALRVALDARDFPRAELFLRKLTDLQAADDRSRLRLARLALAVGKTDEALQQVRTVVPEVKVGYPLSSHSWLGTIAAEAGQLAAARTHLECACQQNPNNPALLNNLAWVLANSQPPELERALELANSAVRRLPENSEIRETRGQILVRLRQSQGALADLEWALARIKPQSLPAIHAALAEAYSQLGDDQRAQQHRAHVLEPPAGSTLTQD